MKKILMTAAAVSLLAGSNVWAACGDIGTTADCDAVIDLTIPTNVTIDDLDDTTLTIDGGGTSASGSEPFCVGANDATATVQLTVTTTAGDGTDGQYTMIGTANSDAIDYTLDLASGPSLPYGTATTVPAAQVDDLACSNTGLTTLDIATSTDITTVSADGYEQTITVTVSSI